MSTRDLIARIITIVAVIAIMVTVTLSSNTDTSSREATQQTVSAHSVEPGELHTVTVGPDDIQNVGWWSTTRDYFGCVVGIGAPIGAAWALVLYYPWTWAGVTAWSYREGASGGRGSTRYLEKVTNACRRFIRS